MDMVIGRLRIRSVLALRTTMASIVGTSVTLRLHALEKGHAPMKENARAIQVMLD